MQTKLTLIKTYYLSVLTFLPQDLADKIVDYILDLYIAELKKKYLHFFNTQTIIYQTYGLRSDNPSIRFIPTKFLLAIFKLDNENFVSKPLQLEGMRALYLRCTEFWIQLCKHVIRDPPKYIYFGNWKVIFENQTYRGIPIVYYAAEIIGNRFEQIISTLGLRAYYPNY